MVSIKRLLPLLGIVLGVIHPGRVSAQDTFAIPGTPKGDLPTELLQSRAYCRGIEKQLDQIVKRFPPLEASAITVRASWKTSPFAKACDAIEADISKQVGAQAVKQLAEFDARAVREVQHLLEIRNIADAREYLALVDRRAKGEIEVEMVRANLLWHYPPYREAPEKEFAAGFTREVRHTAKSGVNVRFRVPMSWKAMPSPQPDLMGFHDCYGHGFVWMTILVRPTVDALGQKITSDEAFAGYSEDGLREDYKRLTIDLTSFLKTKVNGMPALMFTRQQPHEQLGQKSLRAAEVIRAFSHDHMISFQINTLGPEDKPTAAERIKKRNALFKMIGASLFVAPEI
jgi:hypothetical protein